MKRVFIFLAITGVFLVSCSKEDLKEESYKSLSGPTYERIIGLGFLEDDIESYDDRFVVEGDIIFMREDTTLNSETRLKQARTTTLLSNPSISVYLDNNFSSLNNAISDALDEVLYEYNVLDSKLMFTRTTDAASADITVTMDNSIRFKNGHEYEVCGQGGFPLSDGSPFNRIYIAEKTLTKNGVTAHKQLVFLLSHELGHNIGLRHTNWKQIGEGELPYGAMQIAGTPDSDNSSIMNASTCGLSWNGFSYYDEIAIKELYPPLPKLTCSIIGPISIDPSGRGSWTWSASNGTGTYNGVWQYWVYKHGTLVESGSSSNFVLLLYLPDGYTAKIKLRVSSGDEFATKTIEVNQNPL